MKRTIELKPIRSEAEYENALRAVSPYFDNEPELGTPEADQFEMLLMLIEAYEAKHHAICCKFFGLGNTTKERHDMSDELLAILDGWAKNEYVQFVSRSDGERTTTTISKDSLRLLVERVRDHVKLAQNPPLE